MRSRAATAEVGSYPSLNHAPDSGRPKFNTLTRPPHPPRISNASLPNSAALIYFFFAEVVPTPREPMRTLHTLTDLYCDDTLNFTVKSGARSYPTAPDCGLEPAAWCAAEQRAGRAGRIEPGTCYRLWRESEQKSLPAFTPPEILEADLAGLVLELAQWGARSPDELTWLDPPPAAHWNQAVELLQWLDALDDNGAITATGREMLEAGVHPRLAHMLVRSREKGAQFTGL